MSAYHHALPHGAGLIMIQRRSTSISSSVTPATNVSCAWRSHGHARGKSPPKTSLNVLVKLQEECGVAGLKMSDYGITPEEFDMSKVNDAIHGRELRKADDRARRYAAPGQRQAHLRARRCHVVRQRVNRMIAGTTAIVVRTSTYADFAGTVMPEGKVDITGIFTRYRDTWQILMRQDGDFKQSE